MAPARDAGSAVVIQHRDAYPRRVLVLDFDGTICLGDGLVWAYAERVLTQVAPDTAQRVRRDLRAYLDAEPGGGQFADGYAAVAELTASLVSAEALDAAYAVSRYALEDPRVDVHPPDGLGALLDELGGAVHRVVLTNAPDTGLATGLTRLGLDGRVDEVVHSAGKPAGAPALLARLLGDAAPAALLSVGDIWRNDIAPALDAGAMTAFVDRTGRDLRPAHVRARTLPELYPAIRDWAASPADFARTHPFASAPVAISADPAEIATAADANHPW